MPFRSVTFGRKHRVTEAPQPGRQQALSGRRGRTVVVIDDDASVRRALQRLIRSAGYNVDVLASAAAYLERPPTTRPACLVLDIQMPGLSGFDLALQIRGTMRALPIIFISGHFEASMRERAVALGAADVLDKPVDDGALFQAIETALARSEST